MVRCVSSITVVTKANNDATIYLQPSAARLLFRLVIVLVRTCCAVDAASDNVSDSWDHTKATRWSLLTAIQQAAAFDDTSSAVCSSVVHSICDLRDP